MHCNHCHRDLPETEFYRRPNPRGREWTKATYLKPCKACKVAESVRRAMKNPEAHRAYQQEWWKRNAQKGRTRMRSRYRAHKLARSIPREARMRRKGLTVSERYRLLGLWNTYAPMTQLDIAKVLGCTRSYIQQVEQSALRKIRNATRRMEVAA